MRRLAWWMLLAYVFAIPWEYSMDLGEPLGNAARLAGLALLAAAIPAWVAERRVRMLGPVEWAVAALYLWFCLGVFWSIDQAETVVKLRAYFQVMIVVFLVGEFAEGPGALRDMLRAAMAGGWVLALLVIAEFRSADALVARQIRYAAVGQDPNDVARFLVLGLPLAALLARCDRWRWTRWAALGYLPVALLAIVLTASRGGTVALAAALPGCALLMLSRRPRLVLTSLVTLAALGAVLWATVPLEVFARLATIPEQLNGGSLNDRVNIWALGGQAFMRTPLLGYGAGSFTAAAGLAPDATSHNTPLTLAVESGLVGLSLACAIGVLVLRCAVRCRGPLRVALLTALVVFALTSSSAGVEQSRFTWLLVALAALAARLQREAPDALAACFPEDDTPVGGAAAGTATNAVESTA